MLSKATAARLHKEGKTEELWALSIEYVDKVVRKLARRGLVEDMDEARSIGYLAVGEALQDWDPKQSSFTTYAWIKVRSYILNEREADRRCGVTGIRKGSEVTLVDADEVDEVEFGLTEDTGYQAVLKQEVIESLSTASGIKPREREVLELRYIQDLTQKEVGIMLGVSERYVRSLEFFGIEELKKVWAYN